jgi:hypothetical protein
VGRSWHWIRFLAGGSVTFRIIGISLLAAGVVDAVRAYSGGRIALDILAVALLANCLRAGGWLTDEGIREQRPWRLRSTLVPWEAIERVDIFQSDRGVRSLRVTRHTGDTVDLFRFWISRRSGSKLLSLIRAEAEYRASTTHTDTRPPDPA